MAADDDNANFNFDRILGSVPVTKQFKDIVRWKGSLNSRFLILTDAPHYTDFTEDALIIDREGKIESAINPILERVFDEDRDYVLASCCVGWKRNAYRNTPTAPELEVSIPFVEELILKMPRLKIIIALGAYGAELCQRNFNVREMFLCSKGTPLTDDHEPHPSIGTRNNNDKILNTVVRNQRSVRYMYTPPIYRPREFVPFTEGCLWNLSKIREFKLVSEPFDVRSPQLGLPDSSRYIDYDRFKHMMHDSFRAVAECRYAGRPSREHPTSIMINALDDPYHMNPHGPKCITVFNIQYDTVRNYVYLYGNTPTGTPIHVTVRDAKFTFWFRPHVAFAATPDLWINRQTQRPLYSDDLDNLKQLISSKCRYAFARYAKNYNGDPFVLAVDNKIDMHDGAWARHSTEFIRCDVAHYAFIDVIVKQLNKVVDEYTEKNGTTTKKLSLREHYDTRLDFYQIFKPEKMFGEKYNVQMSQWHRLENCRLEAPAPVSDTLILPHATHLRGFIDLPLVGNPIVCLPPNDAIPLDYDNMTSSDIPPDVRGSFDIEVSKFGKDWGSALDSPIICICVCVRRHNQRTSKFWPGSFIPIDGYEYFVFTLGTTTTTTTDETLRGQEHLFQFAREDDMLRSYFYFYSLLKPRYYASHNGKAYDLPFILNRAKIIGIDIPSMGYDPHQATRIVQTQFQSRAFGEKTVTTIEGEMGIDQMDTCELLMREKKLRSYKLGAVAELYVGMTKNDMPYDAIMGHWRTSDHTRRVLIDYCIRDAQLPDQILTQGQWVTSAVELSRASGGVPIAGLNEKGMQEKVLGAVLQVFRKQNLQYIIRTNTHWTKHFNNEIVEKWLVKNDEKPREKTKEAEDENEVVFREQQGQKRQRTARAAITSYFQPAVDDGGGPSKRPAASSSKPVQLAKKEKQAQARAAMAKAKSSRAGDTRKADYQGAVVMDVDKGWFFERPLACLDFAALYPSIMMSENHGPNTKVYSDEMEERGFTEADCFKMPDFQVKNPRTGKQVDVYFLKPEVEKGVYAVVEMYLVALRGIAKNEMAKYEHQFLPDNVTPNPNYDRDKFNVYNQRQNNLKVYANTLYGTMGATGILSDKDIAGSVTAVGRYSIYKVRTLAEEEYGGICRGGDTDSVFMEFPGLPEGHYEKRWAAACARTDNESRPAEFPGVPDGWYRMNTVEEIEEFALTILVPHVNQMFRRPMKIEYEKAMCCAICIAKKRYIYIMCERGKKPYIAFKGIEVVRRDSLPFLTKLMKRVFDVLMKMRTVGMSDEEYLQNIEAGKQAACELIREQAKLLANGKVSVQELILSKLRSREYYANETQEHLTVVRKLEDRGLDAPSVGSRVYFVYTHQADGEKAITKGAKKNSGELKGSLIADDPEWVIHNRIPINYLYYFEHKFKEPIIRVMRYFLQKDMVAAVLKRKRAERASSVKIDAFIGAKRQRSEDDEDLTVSLKEMTEETDRYLFGTASKRSLDHKKLQSRYASLRGGVISSAFVDRSNTASIAHFAQREGRRLDHLKIEYDTQSEYEILEKETQKHIEIRKQFDAAMKDCRACLKIGDHETVACTSTDCSKYLPRVMLTGDVKHSRENLDALVADIEQLDLCDAVLLE